MSGLYIHVPWCRAICPYCSFNVSRDRGDVPWADFVDRLLQQLDERHNWVRPPYTTVFLGGGTPSRMPLPQLQRLLAAVPTEAGSEVSMEANPEDLTGAVLKGYLSAGVTRLSVGVQSLQPHLAGFLGRGHSRPMALDALELVDRAGFDSWSADLIFAVPGQTLDDLDRDLDALLELGAPHISLYGLTIEPGTPFAALQRRGRLRVVEPERWRELYDHLVQRLTAAGLQRYEVSNFARPGHECLHNQGYWRARPYLGVGPGAHGLAEDGRRWVDTTNSAEWIAGNCLASVERPDGHQRCTDRLLSGLRQREGLDLDALASSTGWAPDRQVVQALVNGGLLHLDGRTLRASSQGFPVLDAMIERLVRGLGEA